MTLQLYQTLSKSLLMLHHRCIEAITEMYNLSFLVSRSLFLKIYISIKDKWQRANLSHEHPNKMNKIDFKINSSDKTMCTVRRNTLYSI